MYDDLLYLPFSEIESNGIQDITIDSIRKIVTIRHANSHGFARSKSDILLYYDLVNDSTVLMMVERSKYGFISALLQKIAIHYWDTRNDDYFASFQKCGRNKYFDVIIVKKNIYTSIVEAK